MDEEHDIDQRVRNLEDRMLTVELGLQSTNTTVNSIKGDTTQLLTLWNASKVNLNALKWLSIVGGGIIVAIAALKGLIRP